MKMLDKNEIRNLLSKRFESDLHKKLSEIPLPCELKDTYKAAERIKTAVLGGELIAIVGDYDVDGVVSTAIMAEFFTDIGADFIIKIPNRFKDGYGLNADIINELENVGLIITVDNGISAHEAAELCSTKGIDLIITDHHIPPPILPKAYAIINPKQPECTFPNIEICGAQVAWYLVGALKEVCNIKSYDMGKFLDLLAIAIIADMMELRDLNRILVRLGIGKINSSKRPCFEAIKAFYGKDKFEFDDISFLISPLINSAGRMDDASISFKFLRSKTLEEANCYFDMILDFNNSRKEEEKALFESSIKEIDDNEDIIVTWGDEWHEGVIGIVASRLAKRYKKPAIVFSIDGCKAKGSARSVGKFDILALIASQEKLLCGFGGHKGAAGLVIDTDKLEVFKHAINNSCFLQDLYDFSGNDEVLGEIDHNSIDYELLEILEYFEPYGQKNPRPLFELKNAKVKNIKFIGKDENHLKIIVQKDNKSYEAIFFNYDYAPKVGNVIDMLVSISKNSFRGLITPQLLVKEIYT
ncbi:single-stranded-DNA-specific exonuclease RecJ [Campylobacter hyointestinalis]|uniref:single-stranded-DNA-specific exonuclease RecJ n=3 Tax=Campylobacter hyointestinalis TaxID=198 RepID=UPI0015EBC46A|nr:single-stranded-DNA-specific exonuclease RecJ [Campylobacter hyointestinalis]